MLSTGKAGKHYIDEITRLMNAWTNDSPLKEIAFKAIMVMPNLLLQKPYKESKSKDHCKALARRMDPWLAGNIMELFNESLVIQKKLKSLEKPKTIAEISRNLQWRCRKGMLMAL